MKIDCIKCKAWDMAAKENGYHSAICEECFNKSYVSFQPERSKREDLDNNLFPPPWNIYEHPEKTEGWIEFQKEMRKDPNYYLGCGALNSMET